MCTNSELQINYLSGGAYSDLLNIYFFYYKKAFKKTNLKNLLFVIKGKVTIYCKLAHNSSGKTKR